MAGVLPSPRPALPRLYAILDVDAATTAGIDPESLASAWLDAGVGLFQLRAKRLSFGPMLELADRLAGMAQSTGALFVVNDRADVARLASASGVHLGQEDLRPAQVRPMLFPDAVVGLSTHSPDQLHDALEEPVSYLAVGPVFPTTTKRRPDPTIGLGAVRDASAAVRSRDLPLVAIGGITLETAPSVIAAGAASVAVIAGLLGPDPAGRARRFLRALA